jgi:hypothetical protein
MIVIKIIFANTEFSFSSVPGIPTGWTAVDDGAWLTNDTWDNTEEW